MLLKTYLSTICLKKKENKKIREYEMKIIVLLPIKWIHIKPKEGINKI